MKTKRKNTREEGMALVVATVFIAVAVITLAALGMRSINQSHQTDQFQLRNDTLLGLDAAEAASIVDLEAQGTGHVGLGKWVLPTDLSKGLVLPDLDSVDLELDATEAMSRVEFMAFAQDWENDNVDNNGDGVVDGIEEEGFVTIHSRSLNSVIARGSERIVAAQDVNVWNNAIFAGNGQAGGLINGNVSIHGSTHLLGQNLIAGAAAIAALDLSGTSMIHNNYTGLDPLLRARVPALPTRTINGVPSETLNAKLRVKSGLVGMSGNSEVGEEFPAAGTKGTMDGTYVQDGWTGNAVVPDGDRGDPEAVYSDNGWDEGYDLGNKVDLPMLNDDWKDPVTASTVFNPATSANYTHTEYFEEVLTGDPFVGDITIKCDQDYYYNATRPGDPDPNNRLPTDDFILFDATTNRMDINGQIMVDGNLTFTRGAGNDGSIDYVGRGAILVNGNVTLDTDLYSMNADGSTANSFPVANFFGIMAQGDMVVGSLAQLNLMGGFYAQGQVACSKQSTIMGTFVSNYFDMGTNVPNIYQVPELADNLPLGMVGNFPVFVYDTVSWREVGA
jgi:hypothetical protein